MSAVITPAGATSAAPAGPLPRRLAWHLLRGPKHELWLVWTLLVVFYNIFFPMFFIVVQV